MLRDCQPTRSNPKPRANYRDYKSDLIIDFDERCGYCDTPDYILGGGRAFQIDHFAPKTQFPSHKTKYENLIYCCAFCNRAKWDTWIGDDPDVPNDGSSGFVDPCSKEYEAHLDRTDDGKFTRLSPLGDYMVRELKLSLMRHQHIWQSQSIKKIRNKLRDLKDDPRITSKRKLELLEAIDKLTEEYERFKLSAIER